jgi:3-phenylpropionate/trans-cinnamate dioxygenase ferredoxin subunit
MQDDCYTPVTTADQIAVGQCRAFDVGGHSVLVCRTGEGFHAVENFCTHAGAPLENGRLRGCRITCPLHGASFDVRDGSPTRPATRPLRTWPVRLRDDRVEIRLTNS